MAHDVFVSHSSKDKPTADAVCAMLESQGIRCWVAPRDIVPGMDWGEAIVEAVKGARVMVLVFSASANDSPQIKREVERAVNKGIPVIPLRIEDVAPTASLEYFISTPHWLDAFTPPLEGHLRYLAQIIQQVLGKPVLATIAAAVSEKGASPGLAAPLNPSVVKRRSAPVLMMMAGVVALLGILIAGWWFGIERPRRESRRQVEIERAARAQAEQESARMVEEQRRLKAEMEAAQRAAEKQAAIEAKAKFEQQQRQAEMEAKLAAEKQNAKEAERRLEEERAAAKLAATKLSPESIPIAKPITQPSQDPVPPANTAPAVPVKRPPTALALVKTAELHINAQAKGKLVKAWSEKTIDELTPSTWRLLFLDPTATFEAVEVTFRDDDKPEIKNAFGSLVGIGRPRTLDASKLKIDSDEALQIALKEPALKTVTLTASQMWLELHKDMPVWKIRLWAAKQRNPNDRPDIAFIFVATDSGRIVHKDVHIERLR